MYARTPEFEPQGSAGTRNPTFGAPGRGAPEFVFHRSVLLRPSRPCPTLVRPAPSAGPPSLPASPRRLPSVGVLVIPRRPPSMPPPARRGTSSKRRLSTRPCGKTAAPLLHRSPQPALRLARSAHPYRLGLHSSRRTSSCATIPSTTSTKSGSTASPSSSAPQGGLLHRPLRCAAPRHALAMKFRGRTSRPPSKKTPWIQGAWPLGGTHSIRCQP